MTKALFFFGIDHFYHVCIYCIYKLCMVSTLLAGGRIALRVSHISRFSPRLQVRSPSLAALCDESSRTTLTSSDFDLRALQPDARVEGLLRFSNPEDLDRFNHEARQGSRYPELFALYPPSDEVP